MNFRGVESETLKGDCSFSLIPRYLQNYFNTNLGLQLRLGVPSQIKNSFCIQFLPHLGMLFYNCTEITLKEMIFV